jgi:hypothetical protein
MIAANYWRLSLLPDWHHVPAGCTGNSHSFPAFMLFTPILVLLFTMGILFAVKWFRSGPEEAVQPWRRWSAVVIPAATPGKTKSGPAAALRSEILHLVLHLPGPRGSDQEGRNTQTIAPMEAVGLEHRWSRSSALSSDLLLCALTVERG